MYVAIWFFIASWVTVAMLHIVNSMELPVSLFKSYSWYAGVQDALVQWWYGHNAVAFFLTTPYLGLMALFTLDDGAVIAGAFIGVVAWPALDIALLHYDDPPAEKTKKSSGLDVRFLGVVPAVDKDKKGLSAAFAF